MAKDNPRARRLGEQIQRELTELLRRDVKDERSATSRSPQSTSRAICAPRACTIWCSARKALIPRCRRPDECSGIFAQRLSKSLMIRYTPTLSFVLDTSIEHGVRLTQLIDSVSKPSEHRPKEGGEDDAEESRDNKAGFPHNSGDPHQKTAGQALMPAELDGILLLDKPLGVSSAAAVARAKRLFDASQGRATPGHSIRLAVGMLPICLGEATKFGALLLDADKTYRVSVRLGERTPSADRESAVIERRESAGDFRARDRGGARRFPREYAQVPPMHSAIKQDGKPLYEYARAGVTRERPARQLMIPKCTPRLARPDLCFDVRCTKGAYVRVLAEDLASIAHDHRTCDRLAPARGGALCGRAAMEFEAAGGNGAGRATRGILLPVDAALTDWRRLDLPARELRAFGRVRASRFRRKCLEMCVFTRRARFSWGWGRLRLTVASRRCASFPPPRNRA